MSILSYTIHYNIFIFSLILSKHARIVWAPNWEADNGDNEPLNEPIGVLTAETT